MLMASVLTVTLTGPAHAEDEHRGGENGSRHSEYSTSSLRLTEAKWREEKRRLRIKGQRAGAKGLVRILDAANGTLVTEFYANKDGSFEKDLSRLDYTPCRIRAESNGRFDERDVSHAPSNCGESGNSTPGDGGGSPGSGGGSTGTGASINSSSQSSTTPIDQNVVERPILTGGNYSLFAVNDLGMHCGDLDTRIASILPPFQVLLAQVVQKGEAPQLNPPDVELFYSAASNADDPNSRIEPTGIMQDGTTFKTNFWETVALGAYDPFYPGGLGITPLDSGLLPVTPDQGLPVPNVEALYIGPDAVVNSGDETLSAVQHAMPGIATPYQTNMPQKVLERYADKPFFINFPFGYVAEGVNWFEGAGIPFSAFDDQGRENPYPLVRVQAQRGGNLLTTVDAVLPISGEASCTNCHSDPADVQNSRTGIPTDRLFDAGLPVAVSLDDPNPNLPNKVSVEYAADINILRLHDLKHGADYVSPDGLSLPCAIDAAHPNGSDSCLTNLALEQHKPVVCQVCHYTPALDLAHVGPMAGPEGSPANGRNQLAHQSNSRVMHNHHGQFTELFPAIPAPEQDANGNIGNQAARLEALDESCYQCHPGKDTKCLRGAMFNGGILCSDCHGSMTQVGADFSQGVSPATPGQFKLHLGNFYDPTSDQPRVPWANEPGCGSCHTGDATDNLASNPDVLTNTVDQAGNSDYIRLRQAFRIGDAKATPIVPTNKRFAEPVVPVTFNGFVNPGADNPQLYRVSTGHGGVMCEGCHGATHAEWPNANPNANDNVTANQLQGHSGTIVECNTCHTGDLGNTLEGPHGMHPVGDVGFVNGGHEDLAEHNLSRCATCHGSQGEGNVLSVAKTDRYGLEEVGTIRKGTAVGCGLCHSNPYTGGGGGDDD
jgi:hypothetical protein